MKRGFLFLAAVILLSAGLISAAAASAPELKDNFFDSWSIRYFVQNDADDDGIYDCAFLISSEEPDFESSPAFAYFYFYRPVDLRRLDLVIWLRFSRTTDPGKNTVLAVHYSFYARENDKLVLIDERTSARPAEVKKPIDGLMFEENSKFGRRFFSEWQKLGLSPDEIRKIVPRWIWQPEK